MTRRPARKLRAKPPSSRGDLEDAVDTNLASTVPGDPGIDDAPAPEPEAPTLGHLLDLTGAVFAEEPTLPGFEMGNEPLPSPVLKSYTDATNQRARELGTVTNAQNLGSASSQSRPATVQPDRGVAAADAGVHGSPSAQLPPAAGRSANKPLDGEILAKSRAGGATRFESRIRILDAWKYSGSVATAPAYVDRNWIGYASEYDRLRQIEPGPCLRVPLTPDPNERVITVCRVGDYVVHEEIVGDDGGLSERIEVWEHNQFERLFLPKTAQI